MIRKIDDGVNSLTRAQVIPLRKGERTAKRILDIALDRFSRLGFDRVTMADIAEAAGVSEPLLHYHFRDKDHLWRSAILALGDAIAEERRILIAAQGERAIVRLRIALRLFLQVSWKHPALGRIVALEGMAGGPRLKWLVDNLIGPRNRYLVDLVKEAMADGDLKQLPPEQLVITLQTGAVGVINLAPLMKTAFGIDTAKAAAQAAHMDMVLDALLGGIVTDSSNIKRKRAS